MELFRFFFWSFSGFNFRSDYKLFTISFHKLKMENTKRKIKTENKRKREDTPIPTTNEDRRAYTNWMKELDEEDELTSLSAKGMLYLHFQVSTLPGSRFFGDMPDPDELCLLDELVGQCDAQSILDLYKRLVRVFMNRL